MLFLQKLDVNNNQSGGVKTAHGGKHHQDKIKKSKGKHFEAKKKKKLCWSLSCPKGFSCACVLVLGSDYLLEQFRDISLKQEMEGANCV